MGVQVFKGFLIHTIISVIQMQKAVAVLHHASIFLQFSVFTFVLLFFIYPILLPQSAYKKSNNLVKAK